MWFKDKLKWEMMLLRDDYNKNYVRNIILQLRKENKPVIIQCRLISEARRWCYTFANIRPFILDKSKKTKQLCDHLNIFKIQANGLIDDIKELNKDYVLVCRPYTYENNGIARGGMRLTGELNIPQIMEVDEAYSIVSKVDINEYVNFNTFADGKYVGRDIIAEKKEKSRQKFIRKEKRKKEHITVVDANTNDILQVDKLLQADKLNRVKLFNYNKEKKDILNKVLLKI